MSEYTNTEAKVSEGNDVNEIIKPYVKRWAWFLISVFLTLTLAFIYVKVSSPNYMVQTTVLIKDSKKSPPASLGPLSDIAGFGNMSTNSIENEIQVFKSKKLMQSVVENLGLQINLFSEKNFKTTDLYGEDSPLIIKVINEKDYTKAIKKPVDIAISGQQITLSSDELPKSIVTTYNKTISLPYANIIIIRNKNANPAKIKNLGNLKFNYSTSDAAVNDYRENIKIELVDKDGTVIGLKINDNSIEKARDLLNSLVQTYNSDATQDKNTESRRTKDFVDSRIAIISGELGNVESQKENFKVANNITDIQTEASLNLNGSAQGKQKQIDTETQISLSNDLIGYMSKIASNQTLPSTVGLNSPTASANINSYNELVLQRNNLLENATAQNPLVVDLTKQINNLRTSVMDGLVKYKSSLNITLNNILSEENNLAGKISKVPAQEKMFRSIERLQQIKENLYLLLLQKREETAINIAMTAPKARILDVAYASDKEVATRKMVTMAIAFVLGLVLPFIFIYSKELLNDKIITKHDLEKISDTGILGEIPRVQKGQIEKVITNDVSPLAEAFRIMITNMNFLLPKKEFGKVIFITSTVKGEGKTFTSVNLALTIASPKNKVIIIGSDIRNPQLHRYNIGAKKLEGFTEYLYDENKEISDVVHRFNESSYLDVIYSGVIPPNPTELITNGRYQKLIDELKEIYNYIIVDTAPLMLVADTILSAEMADTTIYMVRSEFTEKPFIKYANQQIISKKIKNVGFVINDVSLSNLGNGNTYGYGYSADQKNWLNRLKEQF